MSMDCVLPADRISPFLVKVDIQKCSEIAEVLQELKTTHGDILFKRQIDLQGISLDELAQIRFFTANQDFRGSRNTEEQQI